MSSPRGQLSKSSLPNLSSTAGTQNTDFWAAEWKVCAKRHLQIPAILPSQWTSHRGIRPSVSRMELQPRWGLSGPSWNEEVESKRGKIWHRSQRQQLGIKHWRGWNSGCLCSLSSTLLLWIVFFLCLHFHRHFLGFLYLFCLCKLWIVSQPGFWTFCLPFQDIVIRWQHSCRKKTKSIS